MQIQMILSLFLLLSHSHSPVLQALQEIMVLRNTLFFRMGIVKWILGSILMR